MDAMTAILSRRSRKKFTNKPIPFEIIAEIVNAGNHAPSAGNLQNWRFIVVTEPELRRKLPLLCHNQECAAAPVSVVVVSEPDICKDYFADKAALYSTQNCAAAVENMLIAANNYGLGAVWLGAFDEERIKLAFDIPKTFTVEAVVSMGYSTEIPPPKNFKEIRAQVFFNRWNERYSNITLEDQDYSGIYEKMALNAKGALNKGMDLIRDKIRKK